MADAHPCSILVAIVYSLWLCSFFPPDYKYLKYVNLVQFATLLKKFAIVCLAWSIVPIVTVFIPPESDHHSWVNSVPDAVWYIGLMALINMVVAWSKTRVPSAERRTVGCTEQYRCGCRWNVRFVELLFATGRYSECFHCHLEELGDVCISC